MLEYATQQYGGGKNFVSFFLLFLSLDICSSPPFFQPARYLRKPTKMKSVWGKEFISV